MAEEAQTLLELRDVTVRRGNAVLVERVRFAIARGSIHALVGPNGAGKSTLISAILAQAPFEGQIVAHFRDAGGIGYVPQSFAVDRTLPVTVRDFLALARQKTPVSFGTGKRTAQVIAALLERVGLAGFERRLLGALSGGELQRVLLANAVDPQPELLVLDEPASGLDAGAVRRFEEMVIALRREGVSVLMVAHDLEHVRRVADRVTVLNRVVLADAAPDEALPTATALLAGHPVRSAASTPPSEARG